MDDEIIALLPDYPLQDEIIRETDKGGQNILSAIINLAKGAVGVGILSFPFAFKNTGILGGLIVTLGMILISIVSLIMLTWLADVTRSSTYQEIVLRVSGKMMSVISELLIILLLFGSCIAFLIAIGDASLPFVKQIVGRQLPNDFLIRRVVIIVIGLVFIFPLCLFRTMKSLWISSFFGMVSITYLTGYVSQLGIENYWELNLRPPVELFHWDFNGLLLTIPIMCYSYQCQFLVPPLFAELRRPTRSRMTVVVVATICVCSLLYIPMGIFGYMTFGPATESNILLNLSGTSIATTVARLSIILMVIVSYPVLLMPARLAMISLLYQTSECSNFIFYGLTVVFFLLTLVLAIFVPKIEMVFAIAGGTLGSWLILIIPGILMLRMRLVLTTYYYVNCVVSSLLIILGLAIAVGATASVFL